MKKQFLLLAFFSLAILAGTNTAWGQLLPGVTAPTNVPLQPIPPLSCVATSEPLHPLAGVSYYYSLSGPGPEVPSSYTWWATKDINFVTGAVTMPAGTNTNFAGRLTTASNDLVSVGATYGVTTPASTPGADSVQIMWSADLLSRTSYQTAVGSPGTTSVPTSTFVVGYAEGENCADNIQVYEINPKPNFTIDIAAIDTASGTPVTVGWSIDTVNYCVDVVRSATYNSSTFDLQMDYGQNVFYYEVAAANFVQDWTPQFRIISGLFDQQEAIISLHKTLAEARSNTAPIWTSATLDATAVGTDITTGTTRLTAANSSDVSVGVSVYVRVTVINNTYESLADNPFVLAVDARDNDNAGIWDMEDPDDCDPATYTDADDQIDRSTITITPRPTLQDNTLDGGTPDPTSVVPKVDGPVGTYPRF